MTAREYAQHRGVSERQVYRALQDGRIRRGPDGIDAAQADHDWDTGTDHSKVREPRSGRSRPASPASERSSIAAGMPTLADSKRVEAFHRAELAKVAAEQAAGKLIPIKDVERDVWAVHRRVRDQLLALPARMGAVVASLSNVKECERQLAEDIHRILLELSTPPSVARAARSSRRAHIRHPKVNVSMPSPPHA